MPTQATLAFDIGTEAAERCTANAIEHGFDPEAARDCVLSILRTQGPQTGERLVSQVKERITPPHDDRAFGSVFGRLSKAGLIRCVGYGNRQKGHGTSGARVWEAT
jgi:hypothetical protein